MPSPIKNLAGQIFGDLTVTAKAATDTKSVHWHTLCSCGNRLLVDGRRLRNGAVTACGGTKHRLKQEPSLEGRVAALEDAMRRLENNNGNK